MHRSITRTATQIFALLLFAATATHAAPKADLWPRWQAHKASSQEVINHGPWNDILQKYISRDETIRLHRFDYQGVSASDRQKLQQYLSSLQKTKISQYNRAEQMAFWINLYNAATVKVILDHLPVDSILDIDISPGVFAQGPWGKKLLVVEGTQLSLDEIEHRILRPIWKDPLVHYAVNCASIGCPNLAKEAFTAENTREMLTANARDYVNSPRGVRIDDGDLIVSSIYDWFEEDFGDSEKGVIAHLKLYADAKLKAQLNRFRSIDDDEYNWDLNKK